MSGAVYYRPIVQTDRHRPSGALTLAGGWSWFTHVERLSRDVAPEVIPAAMVPEAELRNFVAPRGLICGLSMNAPRIMGILNTTPDSFSDGGVHNRFEDAVKRGFDMAQSGADIFDIGGESTRPGAPFVPAAEEIARTVPVIKALRAGGFDLPVSIDTRKSDVADAALSAGGSMFNDVTAFCYDPNSAAVAARHGVSVCLMHAQGDPKTMQDDPQYSDVLLDVYDHLAERVAYAENHGIARGQIVVDVGIGFGKTIEHNLALIRGMSLFHGLGCALLLGVSRKRFIGVIGNAPEAADRGPGSVALGLEALRQGVQILRVHDIKATKQAIALWQATL
ncbi:dihydropteroate synthase [Neptunicoccus cionae]|uniref:Dihydropteroate synthase n=1 Tax=Neptunicoccus cionae TaxID=2035344 RepID=A0A916R015_9RHOB|nr:dihydropteroate synthase [Amylibacter cionae]GGA23085.1 dihydropteroate synthase [Amylibacter cionae]